MARKSLLWRLLGINILAIGFVIILMWLAIDYLAADYFMVLMEKYKISPTEAHQMFLDAVHRYLIWASLGALVLALTLSFVLMKRVLGPLTRMTDITRKIASGDYSDTVPLTSRDEVGALAMAFNRMAKSLRKIEQLRKTMMIDVAHELRTPLTNIQGYLEALTDGAVTPSRETFELLQEETLRLVQLVEDILRLAKADAAKATLHKTEIRLSEVIGHVLDSFRARFREKRIGVETRFTNGADQSRADPDKLAQVIGNLLQNALQYTRPGGRVRISTERIGGEIKVVFANTGGEIAEKDLPYIFERFYRGEKSRSRDHGGPGIGLAIVKELVEAHGGKVGADVSSGEIRVWFTLPPNTTAASP